MIISIFLDYYFYLSFIWDTKARLSEFAFRILKF